MESIVRYEEYVREHKIRLTVFVTTYNRAHYLKSTLDSIVKQTFSEIAIVVLDNHSTDETPRVVDSINDSRIFFVSHEQNIGGCGNLNFAISIAKTEYFVIFHDDDIMDEYMLEKEFNAITEYDCDILSCRKVHIDENGKKEREAIIDEQVEIFGDGEYLDCFIRDKRDYGVVCPAVMYKNKFIQDNKIFFDKNVGPACDQVMWFDVERFGGKIGIIRSELIFYRLHSGQDSQNDVYPRMHFPLYKYLYSSPYYRNKIKVGSKKMFQYLCLCIYMIGSLPIEHTEAVYKLNQSLLNYPSKLIHKNFYGMLCKLVYGFAKLAPGICVYLSKAYKSYRIVKRGKDGNR